jgi:hypothetical protein
MPPPLELEELDDDFDDDELLDLLELEDELDDGELELDDDELDELDEPKLEEDDELGLLDELEIDRRGAAGFSLSLQPDSRPLARAAAPPESSRRNSRRLRCSGLSSEFGPGRVGS